MNSAHCSRNAFKKVSSDTSIIMVTLRDYDTTREAFSRRCDSFKSVMEDNGFTVPKTIVEFAVRDTNISHDNVWLSQPTHC